MKKTLEESFLAIEQMGYGIIDPLLADWEIEDTPEEKRLIPHAQGNDS